MVLVRNRVGDEHLECIQQPYASTFQRKGMQRSRTDPQAEQQRRYDTADDECDGDRRECGRQ